MTAESFNFNLTGYRAIEELYRSTKTVVYRARKTDLELTAGTRTVIIKILLSPDPSSRELLSFRHQYTIMQSIADANANNLDLPGVVQVYSLEEFDHPEQRLRQRLQALVMEDMGGISLAQYAQNRPLALLDLIQIAIQLADALHSIGKYRIVHKDIKPSNIVINPTTKQVKLIDFGIASLLTRATPEILSLDRLEGTIAYMSPEQTGRINRGIDYRSDFYALGVTLYQLLTGKLPFVSEDRLELIYDHLAKISVPAHLINLDVPVAVSEIIAKLMAKNAEHRYQSALGIKFDLEHCLTQLQATGTIAEFKIAARDLNDRFMIPERLYGRDTAVAIVLDAGDRVAQGSCELLLVAGAAGIGKTAVINEILAPITRHKGYFIKGKFDQLDRNTPLIAIVRAFRDLIRQLLSESNLQLASWKSQILAAVGENGQVLIELIPKLERIIGKQPPAPELVGTAAQNRFNWLLQKFIQVFTTAEHPLTIFFDDLQWADVASLQTIELLMTGQGYLLLLGAYRDLEVSPSHPLMLTVAKLHHATKTVQTITLAPLTSDDIDRLVADTLHCSTDRAKPLAQLINLKTQGNPFFITQLLQALYTDGAIEFIPSTLGKSLPLTPGLAAEEQISPLFPSGAFAPSPLRPIGAGIPTDGGWKCDIERVQSLDLTDNVVDLISAQIQKLPPATQQVLKLAACIGNRFDLATLAIVSEQTQLATANHLWQGLQAGLILSTSQTYNFSQSESSPAPSPLPDGAGGEFGAEFSGEYRFLHDRVQQAAYALIPKQQKQQTHLQIGKLVLANTSPNQLLSRLFEIVNHLNMATNLVQQSAAPVEERELLARLNLRAAQKAKTATAYAAAVSYARIGTQLLTASAWQQQYPLALELHQTLAEAALLNGELELVPALVQVVLDRAQTPLDRFKSYETLILFYSLQKQYQLAIDRGLEILGQFGLKLAARPTQLILTQALATTKIALWGKSDRSLLSLPEIINPLQLARLRMLELLMMPAFFSAPKLLLVLAASGIQITLRYGNTTWAASFYGTYAMILAKWGELKQSYRFGQLALGLADSFADLAIIAQVKSTIPWVARVWQQDLRSGIPLVDESIIAAIDSGSMVSLGSSAYISILMRFHAGIPLDELADKMQEIEKIIIQSNDRSSYQLFQIYQQLAIHLRVTSIAPYNLLGTTDDEIALLAQWQQQGETTALGTIYACQLFLAYLFEDIPAALNYADRFLLDRCPRTGITQADIIDPLTRLAAYADSDEQVQQQLLDRVDRSQRQLFKRAQLMPGNFQHKYDLVAAERCRVLGHFTTAMELYDRSISGAKTAQYLHEAALANELAAKFYLEWGKEKIAAVYLQSAHEGYLHWGATAKTADLERRYPHLLAPMIQAQQLAFNPRLTLTAIAHPTTTTTVVNQDKSSFNLVAAIESAQLLSSIIELPDLIDQLCQILLKNSGAEICIPLLLSHNSQDLWQVYEIEPTGTADSVKLNCSPLAGSSRLPLKLIEQVQQQCQTISWNGCDLASSLLDDDYLTRYQPQSVLCLPLLNRGELQGIVYLENRYTADVFTVDRQIVLEFLAAQAVITLHNAQLYASVSQQSIAMDASIEGMAILTENRFVYLNRSYAQLYGYTVAELIGQTWQYLSDPTNVAAVQQNIAPVLAATGKWQEESIATRKDGSTFDRELTLFSIANGQLVSICRDISEQKNLIRKRQRQEDALTAILGWTAEGKTGEDFHQACTKYLTRSLDVQYAFIGRAVDHHHDKTQIESFWTGTEFLAPFEMDLADTPCFQTYQDYWAIYPTDVQSHFPTVIILANLAAKSYISASIRDFEGNILGNLSIIDTKPLPSDLSTIKFILQMFADRIAAEINRQASEDQLRQSEAKYHRLSDNIPGVIYQLRLAPDGSLNYLYISSGCLDLFQLAPAAVLADANRIFELVHPDDLPELQQAMFESAQNMTFKLLEVRIVLSDGIKWIKSASRPELQADGSIVWDGILLDITERQQAQQERNRISADLIVSQQRYYHLIQSVNGVVWEYDLITDRFKFVSDRVVSLFGYPVADWLTQPNFWQDHIYPEDLEPTVRTYNEAVEYRYDCEFEYRMVTADGRTVWIYDVSTLIRDPDGIPIATTGLFIDISNLKQVETDLQQTNEQLAVSNTELQRATQLKDEFLATMSHELRTPLNAILGMSQALQEQTFGTLNSRQLKSTSTIERTGRHLLSLINDILDISKIAAGKLELNITEISLSELFESSLISIEPQAIEKQIQLNTDLPPDLLESEQQIWVDERRMRQVLINLLNNAIKFTPEGGTVTLSVQKGDDLRFTIQDTGIGIASADLAKLFQPFIQIDSTLNRKYQGTGLGLTIVKQIVELHQGTISIDSQVGVGSCFTVTIPSHTPVPQSLSEQSRIERLILLAEADEVTIDSFSSYLTAKGYRLMIAQTGAEAVALAHSEHPDLILIDLQLPDLPGCEAIAHIHQQPELAQIPIIALTARSIEGGREQCLIMGATKYMEKPVKFRELHQTIQECLS